MEKKQEVVNKIIEILEQTDISQGYPNLYQRIKEWIDEIPTEKAHDGDPVSRKDAIDAILSLPRWVFADNGELQPVDAQTMSMLDPDNVLSAIESLPTIQFKRDMPMKPIETNDEAWGIPSRQAVCPKCKYYLGHVAFLDDYKGKRITYCEVCGQAIDWEGWVFDE